MAKQAIDYTLYLVTGRELLPSGKDYYESLEESLKGGVTVVQVREKKAATGEFLEIARKTKEICDRYDVPVLINDRVDIALAMHATGVHLGQDDMPLPIARTLLGDKAIIGASVGNSEEAKRAIAEGADYVGIGAVYPTGSKSDAKPLGVRGVGPILTVLGGSDVKSVVIGGVKTGNLLRILHGSVSPAGKHVDGVAVISEIVSSTDPESSARKLLLILQSFLKSGPSSYIALSPISSTLTPAGSNDFVRRASVLLDNIRKVAPLIHQITNNVVMNQSANATLALGASPIMATTPAEMEDLAKVPGALLINYGTVGDKLGMIEAGKWANFYRKPIVLDPVGVGATQYRKSVANELMNIWQPTVIKGNAAEIGAILGSVEVQSRGVDSVGSGFRDPAAIVMTLARRERCIVVLTGVQDYISDGHVVLRLSNGNPLLGDITGSGCMVGTVVATFCGTQSVLSSGSIKEGEEDGKIVRGDMLLAASAGVLALTVAAEIAASQVTVKGPATFLAALIDALYNLTGDDIMARAKLEILS